MFAGVLVTLNHMLIWLKWVYWLSPFSWAIRSLALNEFNAPSYDFNVTTMTGGQARAGTFYLEVNRLPRFAPSITAYTRLHTLLLCAPIACRSRMVCKQSSSTSGLVWVISLVSDC
jgi:hypothetical protein